MTRIISLVAAFLLGAICSFSQVPNGLFRLENGAIFHIGQIEGKPVCIFEGGKIRAIRAGATPHSFEYGNCAGMFDTIEGSVQLSESGNKIIWNNIAGTRIEFTEREVTFSNKRVTLAGSLILPAGKGPYACVVFVHGSGAETRESSRGLASLFASNGIAALIFDKRGTGKSTGKDWQDSFSNYADDAVAAAEFLKQQPVINASKIGIYGHSQGGWIAPLAISRTDVFSFAILSAANAITPVEQHLGAGDEEYRILNMDETAIAEVHEFRRIKYEVGITGKGQSQYNSVILPDAQRKSWCKSTGGSLPESTFWKENGFYDPRPALEAIKCPTLVLYADLDISTDSKKNLPLIKSLIHAPETEYRLFENANHMMMQVTTKGYASRQLPSVSAFAVGYLDLLIDWTKRVTAK